MMHPITIYRHGNELYSHRNGHTDAIIGEGILGVQERFITDRTRAFVHYVSQIDGERAKNLQETLRGLFNGIII